MKIIYHIPFPVIGGAETQIKYLLRYLPADFKPMITYEHLEVEVFVKSLGVPSKRVYSPNNLAQAIIQFNPDVIQFYHSMTMYQAVKKSMTKASVVEVVHNRLPFPGDSTSYPKSYTDMVVCVSPDAENYFRSMSTKNEVIIIPNGVDTEVFYPASNRPKRKRPLGGFAGRLEEGPGKGIPKIIELIKNLPVDFELVGTDYGGYSKDLPSNIKVLPYTDNIADKYREWDFFLSCSPAEGFGLSIAEALACGLPSVIYNCGGVCAFLKSGEHALVCDTDKELSDALQKIIKGDAALNPTSVDLSAKNMAEKYITMYKTLRNGDSVAQEPVLVTTPAKIVERLGVVEQSWHGVKRSLSAICDAMSDPSKDTIPAMRMLKPKAIVLGCYQPHWENILVEAKRLNIKVICTWHASFILNEFDHINRVWMKAMLDAYKRGLIHVIATPHEGLAKTFTHFGIESQFVPNIVGDLPKVEPLPGINIGILGSGQPWKNMECQIVAASMIPNAKIHIQNLKHPEIIDALGLRNRIVVHPHVKSDEEYYKLVGGMTVNMVVSLSEVYSYFAAESMLLGVPVLTGSITPLLKDAPESLQPCRTPYFEDPIEIHKSLVYIISNRHDIIPDGKKYMKALNAKMQEHVDYAIESWRE